MTEQHIHDCTGPDATCPCGYVFRVPPVSVWLEMFNGQTEVITEGFSCETVDDAIACLREMVDRLESQR